MASLGHLPKPEAGQAALEVKKMQEESASHCMVRTQKYAPGAKNCREERQGVPEEQSKIMQQTNLIDIEEGQKVCNPAASRKAWCRYKQGRQSPYA